MPDTGGGKPWWRLAQKTPINSITIPSGTEDTDLTITGVEKPKVQVHASGLAGIRLPMTSNSEADPLNCESQKILRLSRTRFCQPHLPWKDHHQLLPDPGVHLELHCLLEVDPENL